jgi:hypothetical protein
MGSNRSSYKNSVRPQFTLDPSFGNIDLGDALSEYRAVRYDQTIRVRRLALIALLALTLGQGGLLLHDVTVEHSADDVCQICAGLDRPAARSVVTSIVVFQPVAAVLTFGSIIGLGASEAIRTQRSRGPPSL